MKIYKSDSIDDFINFMKEHESLDKMYACEIDEDDLDDLDDEDPGVHEVACKTVLNAIVHLADKISNDQKVQEYSVAIEKLSNAYVNLTE